MAQMNTLTDDSYCDFSGFPRFSPKTVKMVALVSPIVTIPFGLVIAGIMGAWTRRASRPLSGLNMAKAVGLYLFFPWYHTHGFRLLGLLLGVFVIVDWLILRWHLRDHQTPINIKIGRVLILSLSTNMPQATAFGMALLLAGLKS